MVYSYTYIWQTPIQSSYIAMFETVLETCSHKLFYQRPVDLESDQPLFKSHSTHVCHPQEHPHFWHQMQSLEIPQTTLTFDINWNFGDP